MNLAEQSHIVLSNAGWPSYTGGYLKFVHHIAQSVLLIIKIFTFECAN